MKQKPKSLHRTVPTVREQAAMAALTTLSWPDALSPFDRHHDRIAAFAKNAVELGDALLAQLEETEKP